MIRPATLGPAAALLALSTTTLAQTAPQPWTLVVLPDTQVYSGNPLASEEVFEAIGLSPELTLDVFSVQTSWIADRIHEQNIAFVTHVGDVVQDGELDIDPVELLIQEILALIPAEVYAILDQAPEEITPEEIDEIVLTVVSLVGSTGLLTPEQLAELEGTLRGVLAVANQILPGLPTSVEAPLLVESLLRGALTGAVGPLPPYSDLQWNVALGALNRLNGVIPYSVVPGNHDYNDTGDKLSTASEFVERFGAARYAPFAIPAAGDVSITPDEGVLVDGTPRPDLWYLESAPNEQSHAQIFNAGGRTFLHLGLEYQPSRPVAGQLSAIAFGQSIIDRFPGMPTIVTTHEYLTDAEADTGEGAGRITTGQELWEQFISVNPQIFLVLNGHDHEGPLNESGEFFQVSTNDAGLPVIEILSDFQDWIPTGGNGWLRLLRFDEANDLITVRTYSPFLRGYQLDADSDFSFPFDFAGRLDGLAPTPLRQHEFQNGLGGYAGAIDTEISAIDPDLPQAEQAGARIDSNTASQVLIRFDGIFGAADGQVDPDAAILRAELRLEVLDPGSGLAAHRLLQAFDENTTWNGFVDGVAATDVEAVSGADQAVGRGTGENNLPKISLALDVTQSLRAWQNGEPNLGWALLPKLGGNGVVIATSDNADAAIRPKLVVTTVPGVTAVASFQDGLNGYAGTQDTEIRSGEPDLALGAEQTITVDRFDEVFGRSQGLLRFDGLIGPADGQVPINARVTSAVLRLTRTDPGAGFAVHRALGPWDENSTWNSVGSGFVLDDRSADSYPVGVAGDGIGPIDLNFIASIFGLGDLFPPIPIPAEPGPVLVDVTEAVQAWARGAENRGFVIESPITGFDGLDFATSEASNAADRPELTVRFLAPPADLCENTIDGDLNGDGFEDAFDFAFLLNLIAENNPLADLTLDKVIGAADITLLQQLTSPCDAD